VTASLAAMATTPAVVAATAAVVAATRAEVAATTAEMAATTAVVAATAAELGAFMAISRGFCLVGPIGGRTGRGGRSEGEGTILLPHEGKRAVA
jgi:hypothetical protein